MKKTLQKSIFITYSLIMMIILLGISSILLYQLKKNAAEQNTLLNSELSAQAFKTVKGYHEISLSLVDSFEGDIRGVGSFISKNSPIALTIQRRQNESIVEFLENTSKKEELDFAFVFGDDGRFLASSVESRGYREGDIIFDANIASYYSVFGIQPLFDLLKKEISFQIGPQESLKQETEMQMHGFVRIPSDFLRNMNFKKIVIPENGTCALINTGIIRDDFSMPIGLYVVGKFFASKHRIFAALDESTRSSTFFYFDGQPILFPISVTNKELHENISLPQLNPEDILKIKENDAPTDIYLSLKDLQYFAVCDSLKDIEQKNVGILCTATSEDYIKSIQQPIIAHGYETESFLKKVIWFVIILSLAVILFCSWVFSKIITDPLIRLVDFSNKITTGDLSHRIENLPNNEIGSLGVSINGMLDSLENVMKDRENAEAQLRQSHKMEAIGVLAGGIAHDFNNILTGILGYAALAKYEVPSDSKAYKDIEQIIQSSKRASELIKQMLTFSRKEHMMRVSIPINIHAKEVMKLLRATIPSTIEIHQNIDAVCHEIVGNPTEIHQLLMNLCTNAAHAMEENGGILEVGVSDINVGQEEISKNPQLSPGTYVKLYVKDSGHGIEESLLEKIFDPFFTTKEVGKGTGMGLAVVHGIVESYGATLSIESSSESGTTFTILFPAAKKQVSVVAEVTSSKEMSGKEHILFVDDEEIIITVQKRGLEIHGYRISATTNSNEALELFQSDPDSFDIVITDYTMPQMTGEQLAVKLHEIRPDLPIIVCTGYGDDIMESELEKIGIRKILMKPIDAHELARYVRMTLDV